MYISNHITNHTMIFKALAVPPCGAVAVLIFFLSGIALTGCKETKKSETEIPSIPPPDPAIEVVTEGMDFQIRDTIQSGWQTFRYTNKSSEPHFLLLEKYPEGRTLSDGEAEVFPVFQKGMDHINQGDMEAAMKSFGELPEWFGQIVFMGGTGLISPGETAVTTLSMEPGYYVMECYVKMSNGVFHSAMGMAEDLVVLPDRVPHSPPAAEVSVSISAENGIVVKDSIGSGSQVFAVRFDDQIVHEHFVGHDVNLVRLTDGVELAGLEAWMNWSDPKGLITPAPEGVTFLGGVNDMPAGAVGYFTANLEPGSYALISEVPDPGGKGMLFPFTVKAVTGD